MRAHDDASPSLEGGFGRTLLFGALAAAGLPAAVLALGPLLGARAALAVALVLAAAAYLAVLTPGPRRRLTVFAVAGAGGLAAVAAGASPRELAVALTAGVAAVRSGVLYRRRPLRTAFAEGVVGLGALGVAGVLASPGLLGSALALWGWFVVQSFYFLLGGLSHRRRRPRGDAFEAARRRLEELLAP